MQPAVEQFLPDAQKQQRRGLADKKTGTLRAPGSKLRIWKTANLDQIPKLQKSSLRVRSSDRMTPQISFRRCRVRACWRNPRNRRRRHLRSGQCLSP